MSSIDRRLLAQAIAEDCQRCGFYRESLEYIKYCGKGDDDDDNFDMADGNAQMVLYSRACAADSTLVPAVVELTKSFSQQYKSDKV